MTKSKLNKIVILSVLMALCFALCMISQFAFTTKAADAEGIVLEMVEGAEMRAEDPNGIRFKVKISGDDYAELKASEADKTELGILIVPVDYLNTAKEAGRSDYHDYFTKKLDAKIYSTDTTSPVNKLYRGDDDAYYGNAVIYGIKFENTNVRFVGIGYYAETVGGQTSYTYATNVEEKTNARSVFEIAVSAYEQYNDDAEVYPFIESVVKDGFNQAGSFSQGSNVDLTSAEVVLASETENYDFATTQSVDLGAQLKVDDIAIPVNAKYSVFSGDATVDKYGELTFNSETKTLVNVSAFGKTKIATLRSYIPEEGVIAPLNKAYGIASVSQVNGGTENIELSYSEEVLCNEEGVLKAVLKGDDNYTSGNDYKQGLRVKYPDLTTLEQYSYFYVYTDMEGLTIDNFYKSNLTEISTNYPNGRAITLTKGKWTLVKVWHAPSGSWVVYQDAAGGSSINMSIAEFGADISSGIFNFQVGWDKSLGDATIYVSKIVTSATNDRATDDPNVKKVVYDEANTLGYFHREGAEAGLSQIMGAGTLDMTAGTTEKTFNGEATLKLEMAGGYDNTSTSEYLQGIRLDNPAITDISNINFVYFYVYTEDDVVIDYLCGADLRTNGATKQIALEKGQWTKIQLINGTAHGGTAGKFNAYYFNESGSGYTTVIDSSTKSSDLTTNKFSIRFAYPKADASATVFVSKIVVDKSEGTIVHTDFNVPSYDGIQGWNAGTTYVKMTYASREQLFNGKETLKFAMIGGGTNDSYSGKYQQGVQFKSGTSPLTSGYDVVSFSVYTASENVLIFGVGGNNREDTTDVALVKETWTEIKMVKNTSGTYDVSIGGVAVGTADTGTFVLAMVIPTGESVDLFVSSFVGYNNPVA